jgi:chaperonin cofactor prefoldin
VVHELLDGLSERIEQLSVRIANLETQRTPQDNNEDDMEWY